MKILDREACWEWLAQHVSKKSILTARNYFEHRTAPESHGDLATWKKAIEALPDSPDSKIVSGAAVSIEGGCDVTQSELTNTLMKLHPWRKGPWKYFGVEIDTEWRSDWKWDRFAKHVDFAGKKVLDVGCGNGYYGWRMLEAGAEAVIGCDPTLLYILQFEASKRYAADAKHWILPLTDQEIPNDWNFFDVVFSMGVLYHRTSPIDHLLKLKACLRPGGQLVLETLVIEGDENNTVLCPEGRYAKMRNVWFIPSLETLITWLRRIGFEEILAISAGPTTTFEQRATQWMTFESLTDFLDPQDSCRTIENHPAPVRAILSAKLSANGRKPAVKHATTGTWKN